MNQNQLEPFAKVRSASGLARQLSKIRELVEAVEAAGFLTLDAQAKILGLPRSTAWTIRRGSHKASGLSASILNRMLAAPTLPLLVRAKILEYVQEKAAGLYGGSRSQCRRFAARLSVDVLRLNDLGEAPSGAENTDQVADGGLCPDHESPSLNDLGEAHRS
jgi:hypothetical protein